MTSGPGHEGGCFCGAVRFRLTGSVAQACYCHCASCRRAPGAPFVAWCTVAKDGFELTAGSLAEHRSSPGVTRGFCSHCGTSLTYTHEERGAGEIDVTIATLDDPAPVVPTRHIWVEDKLPWLGIDDGLAQFARFSGQA
jgi:hypothetical protein